MDNSFDTIIQILEINFAERDLMNKISDTKDNTKNFLKSEFDFINKVCTHSCKCLECSWQIIDEENNKEGFAFWKVTT